MDVVSVIAAIESGEIVSGAKGEKHLSVIIGFSAILCPKIQAVIKESENIILFS